MRALRTDDAALETSLEPLLGEIGEIRQLPSGAGGRSFRVTTGRGDVVAKVFEPDAPVLLGPAGQFALLGALAAAGIAPRPIACDAAARDRKSVV